MYDVLGNKFLIGGVNVKIDKLYLVIATLGALITPLAVYSAYQARGYFAFGSEWLVLPLLLMLGNFFTNLIKSYKYIKGGFKSDTQK